MSHTTVVYRIYNRENYKFTLINPPRDTNSVTQCIDMYVKKMLSQNPRRELPPYKWKTCDVRCELWN